MTSEDYHLSLSDGGSVYNGPRDVAVKSYFGGLFSSTNAGGGLFTNENAGKWVSSLGNGGAWGKTLMGASGGEGGGMNGVQYFGKAIASGIGIATTAIQTDTLSSAYASQARLAASDALFQGKMQAADYRRAGDAAVKNIGIVQKQGMDSATLRYNALNAEVAAQRVSAAGSGIDLSSRTVGKAEQTSRRNAAWDVSRISERTKIAADNYNDQAEMAYRNSAFAQIAGDYGAKMAKIQGDMNSELAEISGKFGMIRGGLNTITNIGKGIADIWSGGWVSMADNANSMTGGKPLGEV